MTEPVFSLLSNIGLLQIDHAVALDDGGAVKAVTIWAKRVDGTPIREAAPEGPFIRLRRLHPTADATTPMVADMVHRGGLISPYWHQVSHVLMNYHVDVIGGTFLNPSEPGPWAKLAPSEAGVRNAYNYWANARAAGVTSDFAKTARPTRMIPLNPTIAPQLFAALINLTNSLKCVDKDSHEAENINAAIAEIKNRILGAEDHQMDLEMMAQTLADRQSELETIEVLDIIHMIEEANRDEPLEPISEGLNPRGKKRHEKLRAAEIARRAKRKRLLDSAKSFFRRKFQSRISSYGAVISSYGCLLRR